MNQKKRPSLRKDVVSVKADRVFPDPYSLTLRLTPEESRKLFLAAAAQPAFARKLSAAIREGNLPAIQNMLRARGIRSS
ncbi:hypothetical protein ACFSL6_18925 [Paenibacillus thailandensis]|uniref:Uncharacterized protein n=1 Tax=Paenibacillus thailandensis TaxID=393250 RepID=A0ABW5QSA2_9BACL